MTGCIIGKSIFWYILVELRYCSEIEVQQDCLKFCKIVNNLANLEPKVNKAVVGVQSFDDIIVGSVAIGRRPNTYWKIVSRLLRDCCKIVTDFSPVLCPIFKIVARLLQTFHMSYALIATMVAILWQDCCKIVARLLQDCYETDARLLRDCYKIVARLWQDCWKKLYVLCIF